MEDINNRGRCNSWELFILFYFYFSLAFLRKEEYLGGRNDVSAAPQLQLQEVTEEKRKREAKELNWSVQLARRANAASANQILHGWFAPEVTLSSSSSSSPSSSTAVF